MRSKRFQLRSPQNRRLGHDLGRRLCPKSPHQTHARFLGSFKFPSSVLRRVVLRLWSVPAVGEQGPFLQAVEGCASSRTRSEEHTSELQSHLNLVCRLLLEKKKSSQQDWVITDVTAPALPRT